MVELSTTQRAQSGNVGLLGKQPATPLATCHTHMKASQIPGRALRFLTVSFGDLHL